MSFSRILWSVVSFLLGRWMSTPQTEQMASSLINIPLEGLRKALLFTLVGFLTTFLTGSGLLLILVDLALRANEGFGFSPTTLSAVGLSLVVLCSLSLIWVLKPSSWVSKPREVVADSRPQENPLTVALVHLVNDMVEDRRHQREMQSKGERSSQSKGDVRLERDGPL